MTENFRIIITPRAGGDLEKIHDYIARDSPLAADAVITRLLDALEFLRRFPYRPVLEKASPKLRHPVRVLAIRPYVIYFRILEDDKVVRILHVRHGARRPPREME